MELLQDLTYCVCNLSHPCDDFNIHFSYYDIDPSEKKRNEKIMVLVTW